MDAYLLGLVLHKRARLATLDKAVISLLPEKSPSRNSVVLVS
jgi:hypothetical protein